jgi:hypothetical protein
MPSPEELKNELPTCDKPVGASLLAMAVCQSTMMCLTYRHRQQAGSHSNGI